jgi:hypothetical protein
MTISTIPHFYNGVPSKSKKKSKRKREGIPTPFLPRRSADRDVDRDRNTLPKLYPKKPTEQIYTMRRIEATRAARKQPNR